MSIKIKTYGQINNGKLEIFGRNAFLSAIKSTNDTNVEVCVTKKQKNRSTPQNAYYWGCVVPIIQNAISEVSGNSFDATETHDFLKGRFNCIEIHNAEGVIEKIPQSTSKLSTVEFEDYLESIRRFAVDFFDILIDLPNEQTELNLQG